MIDLLQQRDLFFGVVKQIELNISVDEAAKLDPYETDELSPFIDLFKQFERIGNELARLCCIRDTLLLCIGIEVGIADLDCDAAGQPGFLSQVKGELVDQNCFTKAAANRGAAHADCTKDCAAKGQPVALVTEDGKVYTIAGALAADKNAKLVPHMTHTVEITGEVSEADGKMTLTADALKMAAK